MSLEQRKQELIAKRAKLAELKKAREQRDHSISKRDSLLPSATDVCSNLNTMLLTLNMADRDKYTLTESGSSTGIR